MQPLYSTISVKKISKKNSPKNEKKKLHILCIGRDKIGHDFRNFLKLFFEVQKDIKKDARISPDTIVTEPIFMSFHFTISPCLFKYATFDEIYKLEVSDFFFRYSLSHGFPHDRNNLRSPDAPAGLCHMAFHYPQRHNHTSEPFSQLLLQVLQSSCGYACYRSRRKVVQDQDIFRRYNP